jgi:hypothetical protein
MILTRDKGQRMWGGGGGSSYSYGGGGGGESPSFDGFVSNEYYNQNFELLYKQEVTAGGTTTTTFMTAAPNIIVPVGTVTDETTQTTTVTSLVGPVAKNAIVLGNIMMVYDQTNNAIKVVNRDGSTAANFYATGGVSALGYNPGGGGGGGADLNALLDNINSSSIGDIAPTASEVGKCLVYNGNNQWAWATPGGGGGLTYGLSWSYGSVASAQGGSYDGSASKSFIIPKDTSHLSNGAGFITSAALSGYLHIGSDGVVEGGQYYDFHVQGTTADFATRLQASGTYNNTLTFPSEDGVIATRNWVNQQGFLTSETYRGTVTSVGLSMPSGFSVSGSPVTSSGTLSVGIATGYFIPTTTQREIWNGKQDAISDLSTIRSNATNGQAAYTKINAATWWGRGLDANNQVKGGLQYVEYIEFNNTSGAGHGGHLDFHFNGSSDDYTSRIIESSIGKLSVNSVYMSNGNAVIGESTTDTSHYLQIGGGRIYWDNQSKSLYVVQSDGSTAANFYATGGVSALGISTGGTPSVSALTVGTLNVTSYADISNLTLQDDMNANSCNIEMEGGNITNVGDLTTSTINVNGTTIKRIYWNGTYLQVQIGSSTYNFKPV